MNGKRVVVMSLVGTVGIVALDKAMVRKEWPKPRLFIALIIAYTMLGFLSEINAEFAAMLAVLVFAGFLFESGAPVLKGLSDITKG